MVTFDICKGNPGALTFVMLAYEYNPYRAEAAFRRMQNNGITGDKLYMLWNDCCDRDVEQALVNMECMSMEEIVSHINYEGGRGIPIPKKENLWWLRSPYPSQQIRAGSPWKAILSLAPRIHFCRRSLSGNRSITARSVS